MTDTTLNAATGPVVSQSPARFDLYAQMHKGLRAFMAATLVTWGRLDCDSDQAVKDGLDQLTLLLDACVAHLDKENRYVHPALEVSCPGASEQVSAEHQHHLASIAQLRARGDAIVVLVPAAREPQCHQLYRALAIFIAENLTHMEVEESRHSAMLWAGYSDAELAEIHAAIVAGTAPSDMAVAIRWVAPNLRPPELLALLQGVQRDVPEVVFSGIVDMVGAHLTEPAWRQLTRALDPTSISDLPVDVAQRFVQLMFGDSNGAAAAMLVHDGFVAHPWTRMGVPPGPMGVHVMAQALGGAFAEVSLRIDACLVVGQQVVLRYTYSGKHVGDLFGNAATGKAFAIDGIAWLRMVEGQVAEFWREEDMLGLQRQLGLASLLVGLPAQ